MRIILGQPLDTFKGAMRELHTDPSQSATGNKDTKWYRGQGKNGDHEPDSGCCSVWNISPQ